MLKVFKRPFLLLKIFFIYEFIVFISGLSMMSILTRYILKEQLYPIITGVLFFTFVLLLNKLFLLADLIINKRIDTLLVMKLFLFILPSTLSLTIPMSVLISVIMAMSRLSSDFEIVALRSSGISVLQIVRPLLLSGFFIFIMMMIFNESLVVYCNRGYNRVFIQILKSSPASILEDRIFTTIGDRTIWVEEIDRESGSMRNIVLYSRNQSDGWDVVRAQRGVWKQNVDGSKTLLLYKGRLFSNELKKDSFSYVDFSKGSLEIMMTESKIAYNEEGGRVNPNELNSFQLFKTLGSLKRSYREDRDVALFWIEFFKKHSIPFSCFVFSLIGAPIGIFSRRGGMSVGFGLSMIIFFIYYIFFMTGQSLSIRGRLHPFIGVWNANIILMILGVLLVVFKEKLEAISIDLDHMIRRLKNFFK
jgi:LPS export ABC transporter permease LptF